MKRFLTFSLLSLFSLTSLASPPPPDWDGCKEIEMCSVDLDVDGKVLFFDGSIWRVAKGGMGMSIKTVSDRRSYVIHEDKSLVEELSDCGREKRRLPYSGRLFWAILPMTQCTNPCGKSLPLNLFVRAWRPGKGEVDLHFLSREEGLLLFSGDLRDGDLLVFYPEAEARIVVVIEGGELIALDSSPENPFPSEIMRMLRENSIVFKLGEDSSGEIVLKLVRQPSCPAF